MTPSYLTPQFPPGAAFFLLIDDSNNDDGPFRVADFVRNNDDNEWAAQTDGHPVFLRVTRQKGNEVWSLDGAGQEHHYRMVPIEMPKDLAIRGA